MYLLFEFYGQTDWKSCFWKIWVEFKCFWKTFHLILMHFIYKKNVLWGVFALKCFVFQKFYFSRFSIDRKCDKNFSYNMLGLIGAWLVLDRSKLIFDRLNLFFPDFWSIKSVAWPIENAIKTLVTICLARLVLDWC